MRECGVKTGNGRICTLNTRFGSAIPNGAAKPNPNPNIILSLTPVFILGISGGGIPPPPPQKKKKIEIPPKKF